MTRPFTAPIARLLPTTAVKLRRNRFLRFDQLEDRRMLAAGVLDPSFGTDGFAQPLFGVQMLAETQLVNGEQKIVVLQRNADLLTRYSDDGTIDTSFGVTHQFGDYGVALVPPIETAGTLVDIATQEDKVLVIGNSTTNTEVNIARFQADGTLDPSFGTGGILHTGIKLNIDAANGAPAVQIEIQGDKVMIAASSFTTPTARDSIVVVARYTSTGAVDTTFGNQGKLIIDVPDAGDFVTGLRADNDAVLVSVDSTAQYRAGSDNGGAHTQRLFRIAGNQLDSQFGSNGVLQIPIDSQWAMQADRTLVSTVVFHQNDPDNEDDDEYVPALAMYDSAGNLDSGFGIAGVATVDEFGGSLLAFQPDGGIVLVRSGAALRLLPNGAVDSSFGSNGIASFYDGPYGYAGFALQLDGKIVLLGVHQGPDDLEELSLARLIDNDDGIENAVDTQPFSFSNAFSDGTTTGIITSRGDQFLTVVDSPDPTKGVVITASSAGGSAPAIASVEGGAGLLTLTAGDQVVVTHGSVDCQVVTGPIQAEFRDSSGLLVATADVPAGTEAHFDPQAATLTITGTIGNDVFALTSSGATLNGSLISITSGLAKLTLDGGGGSDQYPVQGIPPSNFQVIGGDPVDRLMVTSTGDAIDAGDGLITLREAIQYANQHSGADTIGFALPTTDSGYNAVTGTFAIHPATALPGIIQQVTIDGYSQPGAAANTNPPGQGLSSAIKVELRGGGSTGLEVDDGSGSIIQGLAITHFTFGIVIRGPSTGTLITGNFIGTDAAGVSAQGNVAGVALLSFPSTTSDNRIERNLISGNSFFGVIIGAQNPAVAVLGTQVRGNYIGTAKNGTSPLGNVIGVASNSTIGSIIGGVLPADANTIAFNSSAGVSIGSTGEIGHGNTVRGNSIYGNVGLGIDLSTNSNAPDGVTQNCGQPINAVTNGCQNFPQLQFAAGGSITRVVGTLTSAGPQPFIIDVYANNSGESQGRRYLGSFQLSGAGTNLSFDQYMAAATTPGEYLTATATDVNGNTSEFSAAAAIASGTGDADGDGITNLVDTQPTTFSNGFSDVGLGGGTTGSIATRGGQALTIVDSPNAAEGVVITAVDATGTNAAIIHIDGQPSDITLRNDSVAATHGSLILRVIVGVVGVTYRTDDGQTVATASLSAGTTLTYKPETVTFIATATPTAAPTEVILIGSTGQQATADLSAGSQITFDSQAFTFTAPATNPAPVTVTVNGAPVPVTPGSSIRPVAIDIKPGDATNTLNLDSSGVIQVAIYSTLGFDASKISVGSVLFAGAHAVQSSLVDVNGDGRKDLLLNFRTQDTALKALYNQLLLDDKNADGTLDSTHQTAEISLTGQTVDHLFIEGVDSMDLFLAGKALRTLLEQLAAAHLI